MLIGDPEGRRGCVYAGQTETQTQVLLLSRLRTSNAFSSSVQMVQILKALRLLFQPAAPAQPFLSRGLLLQNNNASLPFPSGLT